jgi:Na+-driven multidrug efflux pump
MTWKGTFISVFIVGFIGLFFSIYPNLWSSLFTESVEIHETSKLYLQVVAPFYAFFALGLGLYFTCQAFNTLFWPVVGTFIRLIFVILSTFLLFNFNIDSPYLVFVAMALGLVIYGLFISLSLQLGPWKKYYKLG